MSYQDRMCTADDAAAIEAGFRVGEPLAKNPRCPKCSLCNAMVPRDGKLTCRSCGNSDDLDKITIAWCTDDVLAVRPKLTLEQAREVLAAADHYHDANVGINWVVLECHADMLFPEVK